MGGAIRWTQDKSERGVTLGKYKGRVIRLRKVGDSLFARIGVHVINCRFKYEIENAAKQYINEQRVAEPVTVSDNELVKQLRRGVPDQRDWKAVNELMLKAADRIVELAEKAER